jgi:hypothetical protein
MPRRTWRSCRSCCLRSGSCCHISAEIHPPCNLQQYRILLFGQCPIHANLCIVFGHPRRSKINSPFWRLYTLGLGLRLDLTVDRADTSLESPGGEITLGGELTGSLLVGAMTALGLLDPPLISDYACITCHLQGHGGIELCIACRHVGRVQCLEDHMIDLVPKLTDLHDVLYF